MSTPTVVFLCAVEDMTRVRRSSFGYFQAFSKIINTICISRDSWLDSRKLDEILPSHIDPILILNTDSWPRRIPDNLTEIPFPTGNFNIDTFEIPEKRVRFSMLFDYSFVFHPGFDKVFKDLGHPTTFFLPHAVEAELFDENFERDKTYDVGWVGRLDGNNYSFRRDLVLELSKRFKTNDISGFYSPEEMSRIYKESKIVVNISRDDYLQDANLRCFEAMASGALLITPIPTELSEIGFSEGVHYIGFQSKAELFKKIEHFLIHDKQREKISQNAKNLVLKEHTYNVRAQQILDILNSHKGQLFAPARSWSLDTVHQQYFDHFCGAFMFEDMFRELHQIYQYNPVKAYTCLPSLFRAFAIKLRDCLR